MGRLLKTREVMALTGRSEVWIYRQEKAGRFPARLRLGPNSVAWDEAEIIAWRDSLPRGPRPSPLLSESATRARRNQRQRRQATGART